VRRNWKDRRWRWKWWMQWMWWSSWWDSRERVMIINDGKYEQWNIFNFRKRVFFLCSGPSQTSRNTTLE
jgi:hypothetical protein